jgi:hypothetical protein
MFNQTKYDYESLYVYHIGFELYRDNSQLYPLLYYMLEKMLGTHRRFW